MFDWLYPKTEEIVRSKYNGEIKVVKSFGQYAIWVDGFQQSGPLVENVWQKTLKGVSLSKQGDSLINILILGLGCGSILKLISKKWPKAKITGVEIDPVVVNIGKKYFNLDSYKNLKIVTGDAKKFLVKTKEKYNLTIVDAYFGGVIQLPRLRNSGIVLINQLDPKAKTNKIIVKSPKR